MLEGLRSIRGVLNSLRIYYGDRGHRDGLERLYRRFVRKGDLVFDIGAHVGDRVGVFRRIGARVVAVEPQPALVAMLRLIYGRDRAVTIEPCAVGRAEGFTDLLINRDNPTVSTASRAFVAAADGAKGWEGQRWNDRIRVPMSTLDALIARHGAPAFAKIDVEGFEAEALAGLRRALPAMSFEFTTIQRDVALAALDRCIALGYARFAASLGETHVFAHERWLAAEEMRRWLAGLPHDANSGDVYAAMSTAPSILEGEGRRGE
ncbi:MAG: FkbM family methyltransferase [Xanthobacteraceae bacterium]